MKTARFSDAQVMGIFKQAEGGTPVSELCREHGMSSANFYKWRAKFGGMDASLITEMKDMAEQNRRLKRMYAEMGQHSDSSLPNTQWHPNLGAFSFIPFPSIWPPAIRGRNPNTA